MGGLSMQPLAITIDSQLYPVLTLPERPKALLDKTVAKIFAVETRYVNRALKNNSQRFPSDFYFELTLDEIKVLNEIHFVDLDWKGGYLPKAFSPLGINMLSTILKSEIAVRRSVQIIRAFTALEGLKTFEENDTWDVITAKIIAAINNNLLDFKQSQIKEISSINQKIDALEKRLSLLENKQLGLDNSVLEIEEKPSTISPSQILFLKNLAKERASNRVRKLWSEFRKEFNVTRYIHLPSEKFGEAIVWIIGLMVGQTKK